MQILDVRLELRLRNKEHCRIQYLVLYLLILLKSLSEVHNRPPKVIR